MNHICTWFCADDKGEESIFPQTGQLSSSQSHQNIYWRCIFLFFITSRRFNKQERHVFFTNVKSLPEVDGRKAADVLNELNVDIVTTDFKYKTPKGYYGRFQNQFYEFSILEQISESNKNLQDQFLILDSDCIFLKPVEPLFNQAKLNGGFISFEDEVKADYIINGLSRNDLRSLYEELSQKPINEVPSYHLGEFLLSNVANIYKFSADFTQLWPVLLQRNLAGKLKFNEEAHTLSYLYFKNGFRAFKDNLYMRRIWTNPLFYREVRSTDTDLFIWHLPAEKTYGLHRLYERHINLTGFGKNLPEVTFLQLVQEELCIPNLPVKRRFQYYTTSYYRAVKKHLRKVPIVATLFK